MEGANDDEWSRSEEANDMTMTINGGGQWMTMTINGGGQWWWVVEGGLVNIIDRNWVIKIDWNQWRRPMIWRMYWPQMTACLRDLWTSLPLHLLHRGTCALVDIYYLISSQIIVLATNIIPHPQKKTLINQQASKILFMIWLIRPTLAVHSIRRAYSLTLFRSSVIIILSILGGIKYCWHSDLEILRNHVIVSG